MHRAVKLKRKLPTGASPATVAYYKYIRQRCQSSSSSSSSSSSTDVVPVVIVGGGPSGLFMSLFLSLYRVPSKLIEQQSVESRFRHPQAHFLNTRTMELLKFWFPQVYNQVREAMPPVDQWNSFRFCTDMSQEPPLAQVVHPVEFPLAQNRDVNGVLTTFFSSSSSSSWPPPPTEWLSPCAVGHLAQHTFCRILYEMALKNPMSEVCYGTTVSSVKQLRDAESNLVVVETTCVAPDGSIGTSSSSSLMTPLCIAADGAHSSLRQSLGIQQSGQEGIQHLVNVHVTLPPDQAHRLHHLAANNHNHAMLYSIFSSKVVAMVVCHSVGDYIVQIPFFPPYQTMETDFTDEKLHEILGAIFGSRVSRWTLQSARPWKMSALVSNRFYRGRVALVGDAAHVFPPAGGLGMNTGLQDVHNLSWRIAWAYHNNQLDNGKAVESILQSYEQDRRPVAQQNTALSTRNYLRLLEVTKACYLNEQHPSLLVRMLDQATPFLPLATRQFIFRSSFQAALSPLSWLKSDATSLYARHIAQNLRRILESGAGLPLLFPRYELGFGYRKTDNKRHVEETTANDNDDDDRKNDTWADKPTLQVGYLLPHVTAQVVAGADRYPNLCYLNPTGDDNQEGEDKKMISISNLPAQLSQSGEATFVLLVVGGEVEDFYAIERLRHQLSSKFLQLDVQVALLMSSKTTLTGEELKRHPPNHHGLVLQETLSAFSFLHDYHHHRPYPHPYIVLIRPDSHIQSILNFAKEDDNDTAVVNEAVLEKLLQDCSILPFHR